MMGQDDAFRALLAQVQAGEAASVQRLVADYESMIRREIRFEQLDANIAQVVGESDFFQSIISRFLVLLMGGELEFSTPAALVGFLQKFVRSRVTDTVRRWTAEKRDVRRNVSIGNDLEMPSAEPSDFSSVALGKATALLSRLGARERQVLDWRRQKVSWTEIAARLSDGLSVEAVRKRHQRALAELADGFDLEEYSA